MGSSTLETMASMHINRWNMAWCMVEDDGIVYASGGLKLKSVERYDIEADEWHMLSQEMNTDRMNHGQCALGKTVYVFGGI